MRYKTKKSILYKIFLGFEIIGIVFGSVFANIINYKEYFGLFLFLERFNIHSDFNLLDKNFDTLSYSIIIFIIWALGFTSFAVYSNIIIIMINGFIYAYIMSQFLIEYSFKGIILFVSSYLIEILIFLPILFKITYISIQYSVTRFNYFYIFCESKKHMELSKYILELLVGIIGVFLISFVDTYIVSKLIEFFTINIAS